jgi:hypothetical protein
LVPKPKIAKKNGGGKREAAGENMRNKQKTTENTNIKRKKRMKSAQGN